ncbi:hypothetical protein B0A48_18566 [Cryoendolithus antarcticus]|uniref:Uncharacterized protein n=1 Tax=Cryoendolithus antarcticus TaxID=1507870 RepID=A0A1V8S8B0_9PEZI|nr:hypothetical protein B0A48_18566 [Cryoendolithus antarcticus]
MLSIWEARLLKESIELPDASDFSLATVFTLKDLKKPTGTHRWIRDAVQHYLERDDVFNESFLASVIFQGAGEDDVACSEEAREHLRALGNQSITFISAPTLLPGPYAIIDQQLRDVWKLIDDSYGSCMATLKPQPQPSPSTVFETLRESSSDSQFLSFAVQSRLGSQEDTSTPLAGMRIVIKDNIHLRGVKSSLGNRSFYQTFPAAAETAACSKKVIAGGGVIVGKSKMTSFGNWEEPIEYVDYQAPWNPRADRCQSPGGSSSGPASAIAAYEWLDIAIGTDSQYMR